MNYKTHGGLFCCVLKPDITNLALDSAVSVQSWVGAPINRRSRAQAFVND